jgi:hypothetical protein
MVKRFPSRKQYPPGPKYSNKNLLSVYVLSIESSFEIPPLFAGAASEKEDTVQTFSTLKRYYITKHVLREVQIQMIQI